jgi:catechol 2,3-dioxygenase-like lactoylglutathione lyase family enzyme
MATSFQVTFDCADPDRVARFWATALGYKLQDPPDGFSTWEDWLREMGIPEDQWDAASAIVDPEGARPRFYFQKVPEAKTVKNRVHLDVNVGGGPGTPIDERRPRVDAKAERLIAEGATKIETQDQHGEYWVVMQDPEGNEFCLQ